ncbi:Intercellular adhesion molecule 5 [Aix galericulata]|nr:Intercellular adhesion molecule 5 [Aix galericulata]
MGPSAGLLPPLLLALAGAARGTFTVRAWPQVAVVPFGGSVAINCSHSGCPDPASTLGLETSLTKNAAEAGGSWQKFVLLNVSEWSPRPAICHATCGEQRATATATVLVYRVPERVVLEPVPAVAVGESLNLTCRVAEAAPLANLTVTLRRGGETLRTQSFGAAAGSTSVDVSHLLTPELKDRGQDVSCCFNLSLAPHRSFSNCSAAPIQLTGSAVPIKVMLELVPQMAPGENYTVTCQVESDGVMHDLRVTLCRGREKLATTTFPQTPSTNVSYIITARKQDHGENLTCQASGPHFNRTSAPVTLEVVEPPSYVLLALLLTLLFAAVLGGAGFIYAAHYHAEKCGIYHLLRWQNKDKS